MNATSRKPMDCLEIEVKFYLPDAGRTRARILALGPVQRGRRYEINYRFDRPGAHLQKKSALLRLRKDDRVRLTFKSPPAQPDARFKVYRELETEVGSLEMMTRILEALGYEKQQVYEKWRETFVRGRCLLCLDQMPYGDFLEIEGPGPQIRTVAESLGLDWRKRILGNYLQIFETIRHSLNLSFRDLTFENFRHVHYSFGRHLEQFIAPNENE